MKTSFTKLLWSGQTLSDPGPSSSRRCPPLIEYAVRSTASALYFLLAGLTLFIQSAQAQVNISGKPGLINIPTARVLADGTFYVGDHYNPSNYDLRFNSPRYYQLTPLTAQSASIYYVTIALLPRLELNLNLFNVNGYLPLRARGIGDRQLDLKYAILTEKKARPSVAVIMSTPFGYNNSLVTYAAVATKNVKLTDALNAEITLGLGSPYYFDRAGTSTGNNYNIFSNYALSNKNDRPNPYLSGPFGGVSFQYQKKVGAMLEWDSQHLNAGAYALLFKHLTVQAGVINFDQVTAGASYSVSLLRLPKRLTASKPSHQSH